MHMLTIKEELRVMNDLQQIRTEDDLIALEGQQESVRLEFKASKILSHPKDRFLEQLSKEISGLANTEGGQLIIGIKERKEKKTRVSDGIDDGIDPSIFSPEWFQQSVESSISPYLPGLRFQRIWLNKTRPGRIAYIVTVPQGTTAYQANDKRYYGRSEFELRPLPDHEIRLRMLRPRVAQARLEIRPLERVDYADLLYNLRV